jgi:hypothetical protein
MGDDRFEAIAAKTGFVVEDFGAGIVLVPSSAITNGVGGGAIATSTAGKPSGSLEMKLLTGEFILHGLPSVGLETVDGSIEISVWNGELGPSSQMISSSSVAEMFALPTGGESSRDCSPEEGNLIFNALSESGDRGIAIARRLNVGFFGVVR